MLKRFSVENFKGFKDKITFELGNTFDYEFNQKVVSGQRVTKGILYGINGSGKSNLGLAIFDLICHLTDKQKLLNKYDYYLNMNSGKSFAEFEYIFEFQGEELCYKYRKSAVSELIYESLSIAGKEVICFDFVRNEGFTRLPGTETLNHTIENSSPISRVKYVSSNTILPDTKENAVFKSFIDYINRMLLFYSLDQRGYEGFRTGGESIAEGIINSGHLSDFQQFLEENEIVYDLYAVEVDGKKSIYCHFEYQEADFFKIASTGTRSLALFYYWYIKMEQASLVYIDEFDAFYHFELSNNIVSRLSTIENVQIFTTTHNTDLMSNDILRPDCYFIIKDNKIYSIADSTEKELRKAHNLQKMYKAGAFDEK